MKYGKFNKEYKFVFIPDEKYEEYVKSVEHSKNYDHINYKAKLESGYNPWPIKSFAAGEYANAQAKNDVAQETVQTTQVMAKYAGILGGILNILDSVATGEKKSIGEAYREGKAQIEQAIGNISTKVTDYASKIT